MTRRAEAGLPWKHHEIKKENQERLGLWPFHLFLRNNYFDS